MNYYRLSVQTELSTVNQIVRTTEETQYAKEFDVLIHKIHQLKFPT